MQKLNNGIQVIWLEKNSGLFLIIVVMFSLLSCSDNRNGRRNRTLLDNRCDSIFDAHFICYFDISDSKNATIIKYKPENKFKDTLSIKEVPIIFKSFKKKFENGVSDSVEYWIFKFADSINSKIDYEIIFRNKGLLISNRFSMIKYGQIETGSGYDCILFSYVHNNTINETMTYFLLK